MNTPSLYTEEIGQFFRTRNWPSGFQYQIVEHEYHLSMQLFVNNFESFDGEDKLQIAMMVKECMEKVRGDGIPIYLERAEGGQAK